MSMLPADAHRRLERNTGPVRTADGKIEQFLLRVEGKSYRCRCGANVFHKPHADRPEIYECNGCGQWLEAE